jgi:CRP-like cAMP-binding protein
MHGHENPSTPPGAGLFAHLREDEWHEIRRVGLPVRFEPRQFLLAQGDESQHVHVILAGCVKVMRCEADGGRAILTIRGAGDVVGDLAAVAGRPRLASVTALTVVFTQYLTGNQFRHFVARPTVASGFAAYLATRLRDADIQRTELAVLPVRQRLARALLRIDTDNRRLPEQPPISLAQQDLAELVGASRNAVVTELAALRGARVVSTRRREVVVRDRPALTRLAFPG